MSEQIRLAEIIDDREITRETDPEFFVQFQISILLALKEDGILDEMQFRYAAGKLKGERSDAR